MAVTESQVDLCQGQDDMERDFGYVNGEDGGYFFTWMPSLEQTLNSLDEDEIDGAGGIVESDVKAFLAEYLPGTKRGQKLWASE